MTRHRRFSDFPKMIDVIPATKRGRPGSFYIQHRVCTEQDSRLSALGGGLSYVPPGTYCGLKRASKYNESWDEIWMSDTRMERISNRTALAEATGDVLIVGLGLGMLPVALCKKKEVRMVTVLELEPDVIRLVEPHIRHPKLRVILADGTQPPLHGRHFDYTWLDIWPNICSDNWTSMKPMLAAYRRHRKPGGIVTGWMKDSVQQAHNTDSW